MVRQDGLRIEAGVVLDGRYRIEALAGAGGMGEVYRAFDLVLRQQVALKFLPRNLAADAAALDRFHNEARLARRVSHPNVCRVHDIGEADGVPFLSMEFVDGEDLATLLRRIGRMPADKALEIAAKLCAGLQAAHEKGILHRDLKPANIMIDGRGEVLITDFGLASAASPGRSLDPRQGTPAYQAPEQLAGRGVSVKSDLYALGLVLYEMFTGRRAYQAASRDEMLRLQEESSPRPISAVVREVDPDVERAILSCLDANPAKRPKSARALAAALPGADPLAAAMAAGETPSPEMVANAPSEGLRPVTALLLLLAAAGGLLANAAFWGRTHLAAQIPFEYSPEKLSVIAHETARALGYGERPADAAGGLALSGYPRYAYSQAGSELARRRLASGRPPAITYWYRQSPAILDPGPLPEITSRTPPFDVPGMIRLRLDTAGRLLEFEALPREVEKDRPPPAPPDWSSLFARAGLDASRFTPAAPEWTPRMAFDARAAWTGAWPEAPETSIRIEAASWRGRAVSFRLVAPWTGPTQPLVYGPRSGVSSIVTVLVYIVLPVLAVFLAIRNFKQKRGDVRGATRLGLFVLACDLASMVLGRPHTANSGEIGRLLNWAAQATFHAGIAGTLYVALEPHVRRNWPHALITSTRLLSGRWRDAAVGTHILLGVVAGAGLGLIQCAEALAAAYLGEGPLLGLSWREAIHSLKGARFLAGNLIAHASVPVMILGELFIFLLLRLWLRRNWLAASVWVAFFSLLLPPTADSPLLSFSTWALCLGILITGALRWRWGLLTLVLADVTMESLTVTPLSLDPSRWYFAYSLFVLLLFFAVALCGFFASLGGRRLLADDLLG